MLFRSNGGQPGIYGQQGTPAATNTPGGRSGALGSTDANIPIARGIPALSMGAGGDGGGAHTLGEWYSDKNRELGLRRVLLLILAIAEWAAEQ